MTCEKALYPAPPLPPSRRLCAFGIVWGLGLGAWGQGLSPFGLELRSHFLCALCLVSRYDSRLLFCESRFFRHDDDPESRSRVCQDMWDEDEDAIIDALISSRNVEQELCVTKFGLCTSKDVEGEL